MVLEREFGLQLADEQASVCALQGEIQSTAAGLPLGGERGPSKIDVRRADIARPDMDDLLAEEAEQPRPEVVLLRV